MNKRKEKIFKLTTISLTIFATLLLVFIVFFIFKESLVFFKEVSIIDFISGKNWNPLNSPDELSIFPIILATLYTSLVGVVLALPIGVGFSLILSIYTRGNIKIIIRAFIDILAGIPSVVYGFLGLLVLVKFFEVNLDFSSGESVIVGGIVLAIMMLPYIISTCNESMEKTYARYCQSSNALGVSKLYMIRNIILPKSRRSILASIVLALGRGMGETMAVMMVIGNAPIIPGLFTKAQTIPSLIALEMGMAEVGSLHYHSLFASGFILMIMLFIINITLYLIKTRIDL